MGIRLLAEWQAQASDLVNQPIHALRLGPIRSRYTGEVLGVVTDDLCAELVRVFELNRQKETVILDWNHNSSEEAAMNPATSVPLGRVVGLTHRPGEGLWAQPEYTSMGRDLVAKAEGTIFTSPEYVTGQVYDRTSGEKIGAAALLALSLCPRPAQDRMIPVLLSETTAGRGPGTKKGATQMADTKVDEKKLADGEVPAVDPAQPTDPELMAQLQAAHEEIATLKAALEAAQAELAGDAEGAEPTKMAEVLKMAEANAKTLASVQAELAQTKLDREIDAHVAAGLVSPARRQWMCDLAKASRPLYLAEVKRLAANPDVVLGELGVAGDATPAAAVSDEDKLYAEIRKLSETKKVSFTEAYAHIMRAKRGN